MSSRGQLAQDDAHRDPRVAPVAHVRHLEARRVERSHHRPGRPTDEIRHDVFGTTAPAAHQQRGAGGTDGLDAFVPQPVGDLRLGQKVGARGAAALAGIGDGVQLESRDALEQANGGIRLLEMIACRAGDVNGDGFADVIVGAWICREGRRERG